MEQTVHLHRMMSPIQGYVTYFQKCYGEELSQHIFGKAK